MRRVGERIHFQGLPARICWVGLGQRDRLGLAFNEMVRNGELKAPVVIGRDHLDSGSVASPNRETESMLDGSDAVSDWAMLNALLSTASGATWVSLHHGGGVGMGYSRACRTCDRLRCRSADVLTGELHACWGTIRRVASCGMPMRATRSPSIAPAKRPQSSDGGYREGNMKLTIDNQLVTLTDLREAWQTA